MNIPDYSFIRKAFFGILCCFTAAGQNANGILADSRSADWSTAGALDVKARTAVCATLGPSATAVQINSAIATCPPDGVVHLAEGSYFLTSGIIFSGATGVTLRGDGPQKTILVFSAGANCGGITADICLMTSQPNYWGNPVNVAQFTEGYAKGSTTITLSSTLGLRAGSLLILDQENDSLKDTGSIWVCGDGGKDVCCLQCSSGAGRKGPPPRQQTQVTRVAEVSGSQVTIDDALVMPQWRAERHPGAWWPSSLPISNSSVENLSLDHGNSTAQSGILMHSAHGCWVTNVRSMRSRRNHVWLYQSAHNTIRNSYFYGTQAAASQSYGVEQYTASANLIENNIFHKVTSPYMVNNGTGSVIAYNHTVDNFNPGTTALAASAWHHGPGISYFLYEGNSDVQFRADYFHGLSFLTTLFRNRYTGVEADKTILTVPIYLQMGHRFYNLVGNIIGNSGYHSRYESSAGDGGSTCHKSVYAFGWGGLCGSGQLTDDPLVRKTSLRWGNYDTFTGRTFWNSDEVPTSLPQYSNTVPDTNNLPPSLFRSTRPDWWASQWGTPPWPPIGPDVNGGDLAGSGGHAYRVPAQLCYENTPRDSNGVLSFDANDCYSTVLAPARSLKVTVR